MTQMCTGDNPHHANTLRDLFRLAGLEKHLHILRWWETPLGVLVLRFYLGTSLPRFILSQHPL